MKNIQILKKSFLDLMVTFGTNVKKPSEIQLIPLAEILNKIQYEENLSNLISRLRSIEDKDTRSKFKQTKLPYLCLQTFDGKRSNECFISTEAMIFDLDELEEVFIIKNHLSIWKFTSAVFLSPSGKGLKLIIKLARPITTVVEYSLTYLIIADLIETTFNIKLDRGTKDPARACFLSSDPDIYVNENAEAIEIDDVKLFNIVTSKVQPELTPQTKKEEIQEILLGVQEGERHTSMIKLVGAFIKQGLNKYQIQQSITSWNYQNEPPLPQDELDKEFNRAYSNFYKPDNQSYTKFWYSDKKENIRFEDNKYIEFLEEQGFGKIKYGFETYEFVKIDKHIIRTVSITDIQEFVKNFIERNVENKIDCESVLDQLVRSVKLLFNREKLNFLKTLELEILNDEKDKAFIPFQDKYMEITSDSILAKDYTDIGERVVYSNHIIRRNCSHYNFTDNINNSEFDVFMELITRSEPLWTDALKSSIGYMLHNYKNPAKAKAIIFCDESMSIGDEANGGTGKSLVCSSLKYFKNTVVIDGKNYKSASQFNFQKINVDTKVVILDDVRKTFDFESLLSAITSDLGIEKKFKDQITIPFEDAPKFIITTNYTVNGNGNSFDRRKHEIEFSSTFNKDNTPDKYFGHRLFDDWDDNQWDKFYISMIHYIQFYLRHGLTTYEVKNLPLRRIINSTCQEFYDFMEDNIELGEEFLKADLLKSFTESYNGLDVSSNKFSKWLKIYSENMNLKLEERKSNSKRYYKFIKAELMNESNDNTDKKVDDEIDLILEQEYENAISEDLEMEEDDCETAKSNRTEDFSFLFK